MCVCMCAFVCERGKEGESKPFQMPVLADFEISQLFHLYIRT